MKKILAIDDSELNLKLLFQVIKIHYPNFQFLQATMGKAGIEIAQKENPELILLDILMPELNGYEVCKLLKDDKLTSHIPIVMVSALGQDSVERIKGLKAGADAFISKPFSHNELRAQIDVALRIKGVEDLLRKRNERLEHSIKGKTNEYLQKEERFHQISEHAREFYWEVDSNGIFVYVSPVIGKILNISLLDVIGKMNYLDLFQISGTKYEKELSGNSRFNDFEFELKKGNESIWLVMSGFPVTDKSGRQSGKRGLCFDITLRKKAEIALRNNMKQIEEYQKKLKNLNKEIGKIEEKERRRMAENLHDSLGQTLSFAYMKLSSIYGAKDRNMEAQIIEETSELINNAIAESREITYDLSPPILYELGPVAAIKWRLDQVSKKHHFKTRIKGDDLTLNIETEFNIFLYRIVNELLANIIKHAKAELVEVEIKKDNNMYEVIVSDNGVGFEPETKINATENGGFGLMSIVERLESINGNFMIESQQGKGTKARILIPGIE